MSHEDDRLEREDRGSGFLMGLLAGTVLGAGLGMLFAPKSGAELRGQISESAGKLKHAASEKYTEASQKVSHLAERGREVYKRVRVGERPEEERIASSPSETSEFAAAGSRTED